MGVTACDADSLPGDEAWNTSRRLQAAGELAWQGTQPVCAGERGLLVRWGAHGLSLVLLAGLACAGFEVARFRLGPRALVRRGGHRVIVTSDPSVLALWKREPRSVLVTTPTWKDQAWVPTIDAPPEGLGLDRAQSLRCFADDATNVRFASAALWLERPPPSISLSLEDPLIRQSHGADLLERARKKALTLRVLSSRQVQHRRALQAGRPSRFVVEGQARVHLAIAGSGPAVEELLTLLAQQGYGLEVAPPKLTVLHAQASSLNEGLLQRLSASGCCELGAERVDWLDAESIAGRAAQLTSDELAAQAIFVAGAHPGEAGAIARLLERAMLDLRAVVPPLVVLEGGEGTGRSGMLRFVERPSAASVEEASSALDLLARQLHEAWLATPSVSGPAAVPWLELAPHFQDSNRGVADHFEHKLSLTGHVLTSGGGAGFTAQAREQLARVEHARWVASRLATGWTWAQTRDDAKKRHPSLVPWEQLSVSEQEKDRAQNGALERLLAPRTVSPARSVGLLLAPQAPFPLELAAQLKQALGEAGRLLLAWEPVSGELAAGLLASQLAFTLALAPGSTAPRELLARAERIVRSKAPRAWVAREAGVLLAADGAEAPAHAQRWKPGAPLALGSPT